jgi:hypothetical protein
VTINLHSFVIATAQIADLGCTEDGRRMNHVLNLRLNRGDGGEDVTLNIFGALPDLRAMCASIGALAEAAEPGGGA